MGGGEYAEDREYIRSLFSGIKRDSGPGHPWVALGKTKGEILDQYPEMVIDAVVQTIRLWSSTPRGTLPEDPVELVRQGFSAPMRTFVKNEPHTLAKIETGRLRLIIMVPLHLVIAEVALFGPQNQEEIAHWDETPSKPGFGLSEDTHVKQMWDLVRSDLDDGQVAEADVSGYDFSLSEKFFLYDAKRRYLLAGGNNVYLENAIYNCHHVMTRSVFALSDGRMYKQLSPGIMKSGRYVTSSTNSFIRVMMSRAIGASWCYAMGDDSLEQYVEGAMEAYAKMGVRVKFYKRCDKTFEFCSHTFEAGVAFPTKPGKMMFNLLNQKGDDKLKCNVVQQFMHEMRHHPEVESYYRVIWCSEWAAQTTTTDAKQKENPGHAIEEA